MADISRQISGFGSGLGGTGVPSSWAAVDLQKFLGVVQHRMPLRRRAGLRIQLPAQANRRVEEKINALYGMVDFNYDLLGITWRGNAGVRGAETTATSMALINVHGQLQPNTGTKKYRDWLPA
jgi:iron complex outermembrane receptor protein